MAATTKKTTRQKKTTKRPSKSTQKKQSGVRSEVKCLIWAVVGVLMSLAVYISGSIGFVGVFISSTLTGFFGIGAYLLPPAVIAVAIHRLFSRSKAFSTTTIVQVICLFWIFIAFMHVLTVPSQEGFGFWAYIQLLYSQGAASNGGLLGGLLGNLLRSLLSTAGAYIVMALGATVTLLLLTGRSFSQGLTGLWSYTRDHFQYDDYEEDYDEFEDEDDDEDADEDAEDFEEALMRRPTRPLKPLPERLIKRRVRQKGNILDIREAVQQRDEKILLFHEALDPNTQPKSKVLPFKATPPEEETPAFINVDVTEEVPEPIFPDLDPVYEEQEAEDEDTDITVKGLIVPGEPAAVSVEKPFVERLPKIETPPQQSKVQSQGASFDTATKYEDYQFPPIDLLTKAPNHNPTESRTQIMENSRILEETLRSFRIEAKVVEVSVGPTVTRYEMSPGAGVKVSAINNLSNDLALSLAAQGIRIEAPIPGKAAVGIEIPNKEPQAVLLREILEDNAFKKFPSAVAFGVGKDIAGSPVVTDVARMPHLLIAGATGAGKSVCINTLITSILYKAHPDEVKLLMVDPKVVELSMYNGIPHLLVPVVTDPKKASDALQWAVAEMEQRYARFAEVGVRDLKGFNHYVKHVAEEDDMEDYDDEQGEAQAAKLQTMPQIVIIIDELADLMMTAKSAVEESICRLAQKARAAGIHMILATQRPSVDVITGLIKANIPSRLAFAVSSGTDSRTVLDQVGAEKLLGKG
ncbi:MAG: DNA translocase FtsK, partial [Defluviitaleaceae bacterium]|nr:DNA translocase FtsK [Defluviitaleaceae bacterium]